MGTLGPTAQVCLAPFAPPQRVMSPSCSAQRRHGPYRLLGLSTGTSRHGALQDGVPGLVTVTLCQPPGGMQAPGTVLVSLGTATARDPTPSLQFSLHAAVTGPEATGRLAPCPTDASLSAWSHACLTAALSALPPRVPRGRHEPVPPLTVAGRIGRTGSHGGDLGAAETLCRYGGHVLLGPSLAPGGHVPGRGGGSSGRAWPHHGVPQPGHGARCPDGISSLCAGGDRSSLGSTGSVASARSSGSGQSTGSGAHALHAGSEGVKVRQAPRRLCQPVVALGSGPNTGACPGAGVCCLGSCPRPCWDRCLAGCCEVLPAPSVPPAAAVTSGGHQHIPSRAQPLA